MKKPRIILSLCLLSLLIFSPLVYSGQEPPANKNKQVAQPATKQEPILQESPSFPPQAKNEHEGKNKSVDNISNSFSVVSINVTLLSAILTALGIILSILTIAIGVVGALGYFQIRKWKKTGKRFEEELQRIKDVREGLEKEKDEKQMAIPSTIKEAPSNELKLQVEELRRKIDILQVMGSKLTFDDYMSKFTDFYYKGLFKDAIESLEKAIELKPDDLNAWNNKGIVLDKIGKHEEAIQAYNRAIKLKPDYLDALIRKGNALFEIGKLEEAIQAYDKAIELRQHYPAAWINKGDVLWKIGKLEEAIQAYDKAIELRPYYPNAWYNNACIYSLKKKKTEALEFLAKAIKLDLKYKDETKTNDAFKWLWDDPDFKAIVE